MNQNKIIPCIWYCTPGGNISEVIDYYGSVFGENFRAETIVSLGETPSGNTQLCEVDIFGQRYSLMSTQTPHQPLNDAVSFMMYCKDQSEIDHYWDYFTREGEESQCGWCIDKYGLRWQILPENLAALMSRPNAFEVMMTQKKFVIEAYH